MKKALAPSVSNPAFNRATTPIAYVRAVVAAYRKYDMDPANLLAQVGITRAELRQGARRITAAQMESVLDTAMRELDDEALGWFSRRLPWGSYGMLCRASLTAPDLGTAMKRWCRHHRLLTDDIVLHLTTAKTLARFEIEERRDLGAMREFCLASSMRYLLGYLCWAVDSRLPLSAACFPFAPPPHRDLYAHLFSDQLRFDAARAGFEFDAAYLALPLRRDETALRQMLQRPLPLTVFQYRRDRLLVQRVRQLLREQLPDSPTAEALARALHVSVRTLYRQLESEGASLQQLKDEIRCGRAVELLTRSRQRIKQISLAAGFRNEKSFIRAFRLWTGKSPAAYRDGQDGAA